MPDPCPYCGKLMDGRRPLHATYPTADHVFPQSLGGVRTVLVCRRCNMDKGATPIQVWQALLDRRKDPRAWLVSAFICANPWAIVPVLMEDPPPPRLPDDPAGYPAPRADKVVIPEGAIVNVAPFTRSKKRWRCTGCERRFRMYASASQHWRDAHPTGKETT